MTQLVLEHTQHGCYTVPRIITLFGGVIPRVSLQAIAIDVLVDEEWYIVLHIAVQSRL
jgi:hypothetical protein